MPNSASKTICFFNSTKAWGGGEKWHCDMATRLHRRQVPVVGGVHAGSELADRLAAAGVPISSFKIGNLSFLNPWKIWQVRAMLRREKVQTIILNLPSDLKCAGIAARLAGVERIIYRRGTAKAVKDTFLNRFLYRRILTGVIANSEETKRMILSRNPVLIDPAKITVIYNGIDLAQSGREVCTPLFQPVPGVVTLGCAGRLSRQKNQRLLVDTAVSLKDRGLSFRILLAGKGELEEDLRAYAREKGVEKELEFVGFIEDIPAFMASLDIFLLPSLWEGFGYVLVEAMAAALPVVALDVSSNPEVVADGQTGFLTEVGRLDAYVQRVEKLIDDRDLRRDMGGEGVERVRRHFDVERCLDQLETLLGLGAGQAR